MKRPLLFLGFAVDLVILDQLSKWAVSELLMRTDGESLGLWSWIIAAPERLDFGRIEVWSFFNLVMVWNQGVSFGLFNQSTDYGPLMLVVLALVISGGFGVWLFRSDSRLQMAGLAMVIGGAIGNVIDRLRFGAVMDFLDVHAFGYHWPAFNVADSCIMIGVCVLMVHALFYDQERPSFHRGRR